MRLQVNNKPLLATVLVVSLSSLIVPFPAPAGLDEQMASYALNYFSDVDGVSVFTHYIDYGVKMQSTVVLGLHWVHDVVVFPGITAPPGSQEAVDAITSASRPITGNSDPYEDFVKIRNSLQGSVNYRGVNASYYVSAESDYFAQMVSLGFNHGYLNENLNLSTGISYSWDDIQPLEDDDTEDTGGYRRTLHGNIVATQILTPTTVFRIGGELNQVRGQQHDPYRNVYVGGTNIPEFHPALRSRQDVFLRVSQYLNNRSSIKVDYKYYSDDWSISSHTYGVKLSQYITDAFVVRYRYRYYSQTPAFFFRNEYTEVDGVSGLWTGDYRLGDYGSHLFGGQILWQLDRVLRKVGFLRRAQLILSYERYFNSNNFTANIYETGLQIAF